MWGFSQNWRDRWFFVWFGFGFVLKYCFDVLLTLRKIENELATFENSIGINLITITSFHFLNSVLQIFS